MPHFPLSVVIITKNEALMLPGALKSVAWAKEVLVIDSESVDDTLKIAKQQGAKVLKHAWQGFATQKNFGLSKATQPWALILDADERVSPALQLEIQNLISTPNTVAAFNIPFRNFFLGKEMKHGGWEDEAHVRLFKKGAAQYQDQEIHETLEAEGETGQLTQPIFHFSHREIADNLLKTRQYSILQSKYEVELGVPPVTQLRLLKRLIQHFWHRYVIRKGYQDGMEGLIESLYQAFSQIFIIQAMVWERQRGKSVEEIYQDLEKKLMS